MKPSVQEHLREDLRINLGSFYTPERYVRLVSEWLKPLIDESFCIMDPSCGYGAFFALKEFFPNNRYRGNDLDPEAISVASKYFPWVEFSCSNALLDVRRRRLGIGAREHLVIVGNPPYNDTTSQISQKIKACSKMAMDGDVKSRDLGLASLKAYSKLKADFVAVLHPLSYLVKKQNFTSCKAFFGNYKMLHHVIFNSQEFVGTSKLNGFPVIVALYKRAKNAGLSYDDVMNTTWQTMTGESFCMANMDFITDAVNKYPNANPSPSSSGYSFYTLRDINALKRCRTFVAATCSNAVEISKDQFPYYCYIDCFKHLAQVPYFLGNLNIPYIKDEFPEISHICERLAIHNNADYFEKDAIVSEEELTRLKSYISRALNPQAR